LGFWCGSYSSPACWLAYSSDLRRTAEESPVRGNAAARSKRLGHASHEVVSRRRIGGDASATSALNGSRQRLWVVNAYRPVDDEVQSRPVQCQRWAVAQETVTGSPLLRARYRYYSGDGEPAGDDRGVAGTAATVGDDRGGGLHDWFTQPAFATIRTRVLLLE